MARTLLEVHARCDVPARLAKDPVGLVHRYPEPADQEIVGLVAACVAFGNVTSIRVKLEDALHRLGPSPSTLADAEDDVFRALKGWVHRVYRGEDIARLVVGARRLQRRHRSLGDRFAADLAEAGDLREALARFCDALREAGGLPKKAAPGARRGPTHLLPDVRGGSGSKRMLLFLRWMVRPADGVDLGLWPVPASRLLIPVDTHIHKLAQNLGFSRRKDLSWRTTEEITAALARIDATDPARFDFALCHMGMLQRCPSRRDPPRCEGCGVKPICRHWHPRASRGTSREAPGVRDGRRRPPLVR